MLMPNDVDAGGDMRAQEGFNHIRHLAPRILARRWLRAAPTVSVRHCNNGKLKKTLAELKRKE